MEEPKNTDKKVIGAKRKSRKTTYELLSTSMKILQKQCNIS